jgi:hypothetical protein
MSGSLLAACRHGDVRTVADPQRRRWNMRIAKWALVGVVLGVVPMVALLIGRCIKGAKAEPAKPEVAKQDAEKN